MIQFSLKLGSLISLLMLMIVALAFLLGKTIPTDIVVAVPSHTANSLTRDHHLIVIDLNADIITPVRVIDATVVHAQLIKDKILLVTHEVEQDAHREEMLLYNPSDQSMTSLLMREGARQKLLSVTSYGVSFDDHFEKMLYRHPDDLMIHLLDVRTAESIPITAASPITFGSSPPKWSRDLQQVAFEGNKTIEVFEIENTNLQSFERRDIRYSFEWSPDDTHILVFDRTSQNRLRLFDIQTGELHPIVNEMFVENFSLSWHTCDAPIEDQWLVYRHPDDTEVKRDHILLNLGSGEETRLIDKPRPQTLNIIDVSWWKDCDQLLLYVNSTPSATDPNYVSYYDQLYVTDLDGENLILLGSGMNAEWHQGEDRFFYWIHKVGYPADDIEIKVYEKDTVFSETSEHIGTYTFSYSTWYPWTSLSSTKALYLSTQAGLVYVNLSSGDSFPLLKDNEVEFTVLEAK